MSPLSVPSDIEIATGVKPRPIVDVAGDLGLTADDLELYGKYKAKLPLDITAQPARGRLVIHDDRADHGRLRAGRAGAPALTSRSRSTRRREASA